MNEDAVFDLSGQQEVGAADTIKIVKVRGTMTGFSIRKSIAAVIADLAGLVSIQQTMISSYILESHINPTQKWFCILFRQCGICLVQN